MLSVFALVLMALIPPAFWYINMHVAAVAWGCVIYPSLVYIVYDSVKTRTWPTIVSVPHFKWGGKK